MTPITNISIRLATLGLVLAWAAPSVPAGEQLALLSQEEESPEASPASDQDPRRAKQKRVLHLTNGISLRGLAYWDDDHWQLRRNGEWHALPADQVLRWRDEAELAKEHRKRARDLPAKDLEERVALAEWLEREGLMEEALEEIDRVLRLEPDQRGALALLQSPSFPRPSGGDPVADPEGYARRVSSAGVSAGPAQRELLIQSLGRLTETDAGLEALRKVLGRELGSYRILRRTFACHALRRLLPGEEVLELLRRCGLDTSRPVREEASLALRATDEPGIVEPLVRALNSDSRAVRTNAAESLGNVGFPVAVPALVNHFASLPTAAGSGSGARPPAAHIYIGNHFAYVGDFDVEIAQGASIADPIVKHGEEAKVLDVRVGGISGYTYQTEYKTVRAALRRLTGANPGSSPGDWQRWYTENRQRFESRSSERPETRD